MDNCKTRHLWPIFLDPQFKEGVQAQVAIDIADEIQRLTRERDAALEDTARLDWLDRYSHLRITSTTINGGQMKHIKGDGTALRASGGDLRDVIDASRTQPTPVSVCAKCNGTELIQGRPTFYETDSADERRDAWEMAKRRCDCAAVTVSQETKL